jgi:toxin FitB
MILLDTNIVSEVMRLRPNPGVIAWLDRQGDIEIWDTLSGDFDGFLQTDIQGRVVVFDTDAARLAASIAAVRRQSGRTGGLCDTMIAGIALATGAELATRNTRHFEDLSITLIDPWMV